MSRRIRTTRQARKLRAIAIWRKHLAKAPLPAVTAVKIAADAVTLGKISAGAITADKISAGAVMPERLRLEYPPHTTSRAPEGSPE